MPKTKMETTRFVIESATGRSTVLFRLLIMPMPTHACGGTETGCPRQNGTAIIRSESIDPEDWDLAHGVNADSIPNRVVRRYEANPSRGSFCCTMRAATAKQLWMRCPRLISYFKNGTRSGLQPGQPDGRTQRSDHAPRSWSGRGCFGMDNDRHLLGRKILYMALSGWPSCWDKAGFSP